MRINGRWRIRAGLAFAFLALSEAAGLLTSGAPASAAGTIAGTVIDAQSLAPIAGITVALHSPAGALVVSTTTAGNGTFAVNVEAGTYFARTVAGVAHNFQDALFDGRPCFPSCVVITGTPISVSDGVTTSGVDFALQPGGTLSGSVTNSVSGLPLQGLTIRVATAGIDAPAKTITTDASGVFVATGLATGDYTVMTRVQPNQNYVDELYHPQGNLSCFESCVHAAGARVRVTAGAATSGINFALDPGGSISGVVTIEGSAVAVPGLTVRVVSPGGQVARTAVTDSNGMYTADALPSGSYHVRTHAASHQNVMDEIYPGISAFPATAVVSGTAVAVVGGATTTGIDFQLSPGGTITGAVSASASGQPLAGVTVYVEGGIQPIKTTSSDPSGTFVVAGLPAGSYRVRTSVPLDNNYIDEVYNGLVCIDGCSTGVPGTPVIVQVGATTSGIDFALEGGASVSGVVTDESSGLPLANIPVRIGAKIVTSDWQGVYTVTGLAAGSHFVQTALAADAAYIPELFDNIPCAPFCSSGSAVVVSAGATVSGINFALSPGGGITGVVTDAGSGLPIDAAQVIVMNGSGAHVKVVRSNGSGIFVARGLPAGTYYAQTSLSIADEYVNQIFSGGQCHVPPCLATSGTPIVVSGGAVTGGVNFPLLRGGTITGTVATPGGVPPVSPSIAIANSTGVTLQTVPADAHGKFIASGLPTGVHYARTQLPFESNYLNQMYDHQPCYYPFCAVVDGTPISVTTGAVTPNVNFTLGAAGRITGTVTNESTGAPLVGITIRVSNSSGTVIRDAVTNLSGIYSVVGLATASYTVRSVTFPSFRDEFYPNNSCTNTLSCAPPTPVSVTAGSATTDIDFALAPLSGGGAITGSVTQQGNPSIKVSGVFVSAYNGAGLAIKSAPTNSSGDYVLSGVPDGTYYLRTESPFAPWVDELYQELPCAFGCSLTTGAPVIVANGGTTSGIDFTLVPAGTVTGSVINSATSTGAGVTVSFFDATGTFRRSALPFPNGAYSIVLPPGQYFAMTAATSTFNAQLFNGINCAQPCNPTTGTAINVLGGLTTSNVNFLLPPITKPTGSLSGTVTDAGSGTPLPGIAIDVVSIAGTPVSGGSTNGAGVYTVAGLPPGSYLVKARATNHVDEVYPDKPCAGCSVTIGSPVAVTAGNTTGGIDFALAMGGSISGQVTDQLTGAGFGQGRVWLYSSSGAVVESLQPDNINGTFMFSGLPPGAYTLKADGVQYQFSPWRRPYVDQMYGGGPCSLQCVVTAGSPITVLAGVTTTGIDVALTAAARISGTVRDAATGVPVTSIPVHVYTDTGFEVSRVWVELDGRYNVWGLPAGSYYVRLSSTDGYIDEVFDDVPITGLLPPTAGTLITVAAGETRNGVNFDLAYGGAIQGTVTDSANALPLAGITVQVYAASGKLARQSLTGSDGTYSVVGLPAGSYYARTSGKAGYRDRIFDGPLLCEPDCSPLSGTPINVAAGATAGGINFALPASSELIQNGDFSNGLANWTVFALPDLNHISWQVQSVSPANSRLHFYRVPSATPGNQAVVLQNTNAAVAQDANLLAQFELSNTSSARKRISVLIHDGNFSDLAVCTFWLPPGTDDPVDRRRYAMRTRTTRPWTNATISLYAASPGSDGGAYVVDNVSMQPVGGTFATRTDCIDPLLPDTGGGPDGPEMLVNGGFANGLQGWTTYGQIVSQVAGGVFEFYRPSATPDPAGVILQPTGQSVSAGERLTAQFDLGNSSAVPKRVTVLLHDLAFGDLSACTFWLDPGQTLSTYTMRSFATRPWTNATISVYAATVGNDSWIQLDNVTLRRTPSAAMVGTECIEPASTVGLIGDSISSLAQPAVPPAVREIHRHANGHPDNQPFPRRPRQARHQED